MELEWNISNCYHFGNHLPDFLPFLKKWGMYHSHSPYFFGQSSSPVS